MHLDPFDLHLPSTVPEVLELAEAHRGHFDFLAGGSDLLPNYKMHLNLRSHLIGLERVSELKGRTIERIGAMERLADLERDRSIAASFPAVAEAAREVATPLVRAQATVGGNLLVETRCFFFNQSQAWRESLGFCLKADGDACHVVPQKERCYATFSGDLAPALMVHGARVEIAGASGRREVALADLYDPHGDGIRRTRLAPGELLVSVAMPSEGRGRASAYRKLRVRPSFDFPELGVAVAGRFEDDRAVELSLAVGGLETYPKPFDELVAPLLGGPLSDERLRSVGEEVVRRVRPVHNTFLAADYRRKMAGVFTRRALEAIRPNPRRAS